MSGTWGPYRGVVDRVIDGDTVYVRLDVGFDLAVYARCRVSGIDAPEVRTEEGKLARDYATGLLPLDAAVQVVSHGWDKYGGRIDASITLPDGRDFATVMLEAGHATRYPA